MLACELSAHIEILICFADDFSAAIAKVKIEVSWKKKSDWYQVAVFLFLRLIIKFS